MPVTDIHPDWFDHPIITTAMRRGDGDPRQLLCDLYDVLTELEREIPGVPFAKILSGANIVPRDEATPRRALYEKAMELRAEGHQLRQVAALLGHLVSYTTIRRWELGMNVPPMEDGSKRRAVYLFAEMHGAKAAAQHFEIDVQTVYSYCSKMRAKDAR